MGSIIAVIAHLCFLAKPFKAGFATLAVLVALLGLGTRAMAATPEWKVLALSTIPRTGELGETAASYGYPMSAACPSLGHCTVLTGYANVRTAAVTQNGDTWSASAVPLPEGAESPYAVLPALGSLTCPVVGSCVALGGYAEHSNGKPVGMTAVETDGSWSATQVPLPNQEKAPYPDLVFDYWIGLSCPATGWCVAIAGYGPEPRTSASAAVAYVMADGTWSASWLPVPPDSWRPGAEVNGVACSGVESCTAAGGYDALEGAKASTYPVLWTYSDGVWSAARASEPPGTSEGSLAEVVCPLGSNCSAEGQFSSAIDGHFELELFNEVGGTWQTQEVPLPAGASFEEVGLGCAATASCTLLVRAGPSGVEGQPYLFDEVSGKLGTGVLLGPVPGEIPYSLRLNRPVCPQVGWCTAAGELEDAHGQQGVFLTDNHGVATLELAPPPIGAEQWPGFAYLSPESLACSGIDACVFAAGDLGQLVIESAGPQSPSEPAGGSSSGGSGNSGGGSGGSSGGVTPPVATNGVYVALGDSFSAGQGNPPYLPGTDTKRDSCHRSAISYPFDTNIDLGFFAPRFSFHACSGAVIPDFFHDRNGEPPQLSWLSGADSLVTLTIGGNDAYFAKAIASCVISANCEGHWKQKVNGAIAAMGHYAPTNGESLQRLYITIANHAPNAKVVVVGYPRFFPNSPPEHCASELGPTLNKSKMLWINSEIKHMDHVIKSAVAGAKRSYPRIVYVETSYDAFAGHELCTTEPYMYGVKASFSSKTYGGSFHPNLSGQAALAKLVEAAAVE